MSAICLARPRYPMPFFVRNAVPNNKLMQDYKVRQLSQQNDFISWINTAKLQETRVKRLNQMLDELRKGNLYMNMKWIREDEDKPEQRLR